MPQDICRDPNCEYSDVRHERGMRCRCAIPDLKRVIMEVGNALVTGHGYDPAAVAIVNRPVDLSERSTFVLALVTEFLNQHPEAREELKKLGFEWSM